MLRILDVIYSNRFRFERLLWFNGLLKTTTKISCLFFKINRLPFFSFVLSLTFQEKQLVLSVFSVCFIHQHLSVKVGVSSLLVVNLLQF